MNVPEWMHVERVSTSRLAILTILCALSMTAAILNPVAQGTAAPISASAFVGWRDDFNDSTKVTELAGLQIDQGTVRLPQTLFARQGLVIPRSGSTGFDSDEAGAPTVLSDGGMFKMWYFGRSGGVAQIGYATSADGRLWTKLGPVLSPSRAEEAGGVIAYPEVIQVGATYRMWYSAYDGSHFRIMAATSSDGVTWTKEGVAVDLGSPGAPDSMDVYDPSVLRQGGTYYMWYTGRPTEDPGADVIMLASSIDGNTWTKQGVVLAPGPFGSGDDIFTESPSVRFSDGMYRMVYAGRNSTGERLFYAESTDGSTWEKRGTALDLLPPDESPTMAFPFLHLLPDGSWFVYYTARGSSLQIFLATSVMTANQGTLRSIPVSVPQGLDWVWLNQSYEVPAFTSIQISVLDADTLTPLLANRSVGSINLRDIDPIAHDSLVLMATLRGGFGSSPTLDAWWVVWDVSATLRPPAPSLPDSTLLVAVLMIGGGGVALAIVAWEVLRSPRLRQAPSHHFVRPLPKLNPRVAARIPRRVPE
jgi:predicted GH43/DUF377 family glycosyl hydrolase